MLLKATQNNPLSQYLLLLALSVAFWSPDLFASEGKGTAWASWAWMLATSAGASWIAARHQLSRNPGIVGIVFLCLANVHALHVFSIDTWLYPAGLLITHCGLEICGKPNAYPAIFNTAFLWGLVTFLLPELFFTLPCIFCILIAYSRNRWREWACVLIGAGSAYLLLFAAHFLSQGRIPWVDNQEALSFGILPWQKGQTIPLVLTALCLAFSMVSILSFRRYHQDLEISERHKSSALAVMLFYFTIFFTISGTPLSERFFLLFPVAFFCTKFLEKRKNRFFREACFLAILLIGILHACLRF